MLIEKVLRCPVCAESPVENATCAACGHACDTDGGTPCLFPVTREMHYEMRYVPLQEVQSILAQSFGYPEAAGASDEVYHLDQAHAACFARLAPGAVVLEIGCGGGQMRAWVEQKGFAYIGTDISKTRVTETLQKFGGPDFLSDAHHLPIRNNSIDLVYSAAVTEHLAAPQRAMQEIFRVLKPGGFYLGNCSFMEPWHDESFFHISPNGAAALLAQAGFAPLSIWPSKNYSGYRAMPRMDNAVMRRLALLGRAMHGLSRMSYGLKRRLRGARYSESAQLADLAKTAGAIDWIAQKPD